MGNIAQQFATAFRDFVADGVASSGPHEVVKEEVRAIGPLIESAISNAALGALVDVVYPTRAELYADLAHPADTVALVYGDATDANNDLYIKTGASGAGAWTPTTILHDAVATAAGPILAEVEAFALRAEAAEANAETAAAAAQTFAGQFFASVRFPPENGEDPVDIVTALHGENGMFALANTNNLFRTTVDYDTPWLNTAGAICGTCTIESLIYDGLSRSPYLCGTNIEGTTSRFFAIRYTPRASTTNASKAHRLSFVARGEAGTGQAVIDTVIIPDGVSRIAWKAKIDATNITFDIWDCDTGTKYAGTPTAKPAGWVGISRCTNNFSIGGVREAEFPRMCSSLATAAQAITAFRGEIGFVALLDADISDADFAEIATGAALTSKISDSNIRLHCPLTSAGQISLAVTSNRAALTNGLTQKGTIYPGSSIRQASPTAFIMPNKLPDPCLCTVPYGAESALLALGYRFTGVSGDVQVQVTDESGRVLRPFYSVGRVPSSGTTGTAWISLPWHPSDEAYRLTIRAKDAGGAWVYAYINTDVVVTYTGVHLGQSEMVRGLNYLATVNGNTGDGTRPLGETYSTGGKHVYRCTWNSTSGKPVIYRTRFNPNLACAGQIRIVNRLRERYTSRPITLVNAAVSGTSLIKMLNDAATGTDNRNWSDFELALAALGNSDRQGRKVITAIVVMWEQFYGGTLWAEDVFRPAFLGLQSINVGSGIAQADIDHSFYDGRTLNPSFATVVMPGNRSVSSPGGTTDALTAADKRQNMREVTGTLGAVFIGPECASHALETSGVDAGTHPDVTRETGIGPWTRSLGEGYAIGFGLRTYSPVKFSYAFGSSNAEVIATINSTRTGALDTEENLNAEAYGVSRTNPEGLTVQGFEVQDGGAGAWTKDGFTATIINARQVRLTKASGTWAAGTRWRHKPGAPGNYANFSGAGNAATEDAWVKQSIRFNADEVAGDNTAFVTA